jgi:hypothetical protein
MSIRLHHLNRLDATAYDWIDASLTTVAASQTNTYFFQFTPGYRFLILGAQLYGTTFTNITSVDVGTILSGTYQSALNAQITPSAGNIVAGVLASTVIVSGSKPPGMYGGPGMTLACRYTSGTGPAVANVVLSILTRPMPMDGDPQITYTGY